MREEEWGRAGRLRARSVLPELPALQVPGEEGRKKREREGKGGQGRKGRAVIDSSAQPHSRHPNPTKFAFTRRELCCCHENGFYEHRAPSPSRWDSQVEKLKW